MTNNYKLLPHNKYSSNCCLINSGYTTWHEINKVLDWWHRKVFSLTHFQNSEQMTKQCKFILGSFSDPAFQHPHVYLSKHISGLLICIRCDYREFSEVCNMYHTCSMKFESGEHESHWSSWKSIKCFWNQFHVPCACILSYWNKPSFPGNKTGYK